ncbi:MAG: hypothetical protein V5A68_04890 [Candidatus Thermoplasmatota archaeon]
MLLVAGDTYPECRNHMWEGYEGEYYANIVAKNMSNFKPTPLSTSDGSLSG